MTPLVPAPWEQAAPDSVQFAEDLWFVEFAAEPRATGGTIAAQRSDRVRFSAEAADAGLQVTLARDHTTLWNGLTVRTDADQAAALRSLPSVTNVYPVGIVAAPEPEEVSPDLVTALAMTGADVVQSELGFTGAGLSVGVLDTGIDYNHPDLGGDGDQSRRLEADPVTRELDHPRVTHGWDYVGEEFDSSDPSSPPPAPDPDPFDLRGHGTHVSGIVGANAQSEGGATGVAPGVTLGMYKVFGPGSTTADVIIDALEDAYTDGMDIVNMSLGASFAWGDYPTSQASNALVAQGVTVVASAGNSGGAGAYSLGAPGNASDAIGVASADNTFVNALVFEVAQLADPLPYNELAGAELPPTDALTDEVAWVGRACVDSLGDELLDDPAGKTALVVRGDCTFAEKYLAAADAGATGVLIFNNIAGLFAGTIVDAGIPGVWGAGTDNASGTALVDLITGGETVEIQFTEETKLVPNPTGGLASSFTSYGQDPTLNFKPSIMAPGGLIRSTWPLAAGGYAVISGTSMSSPHVAGAVALLLEAEPGLDPFQVRDRLQNTAEPANWSLNPGLGFPDHTFRQGAGMLQIDQTILADQQVAPAQLAFADQDQVTTTLTLSNRGDVDVTYEIGHAEGVQTAINTFAPGFFLAPAGFNAPAMVTVPAGGTAQVGVTITAPNVGLPNHQYGGWVTFTPTDPDAAGLRVPYVGFAGDYVAGMPLLGYWDVIDGAIAFVEIDPFLAQVDQEGELAPVEPGHVFRPRQGDFPVLAPFYGHFPQRLEVYVTMRSGRQLLAIEDDFLPRSAAIGAPRPVLWDGMVPAGSSENRRPVPPGTYTLELRVLRTLGDAGNPDHWDVWQSPEFVISHRPG